MWHTHTEMNGSSFGTLASGYASAIVTGFITTAVWVNRPGDIWVPMLSVVAVIFLTEVPMGRFVRGMRPFLFFASILWVFGSIGSGSILFRVGPIHFSREAVLTSTFYALRLIYIGGVTVWLMSAIGFQRIIGGLHGLHRKMKSFGLNIAPILFTMAIAVRFLPLLQEEADRLRLGLHARGALLLGKGPIGTTRRVVFLVIPLLAASLRRAEALSDALELRVADPSRSSMGVDEMIWDDVGNLDRSSGAASLPSFRAVLAVIAAWAWIIWRFGQYIGKFVSYG